MAIGPVTINGMIQRTQDVGALKQQEDGKSFAAQQNIQAQIKSQENLLLKQVSQTENTENHEERYDAKEKGNNEYEGKQRKRKSKKKGTGKVLLKKENGHFDMKV